MEYTRGYTSRRRIDERSPTMSYHVQIESRLSLTGSNADRRLRVAPGEIGHVATHLAATLAQRAATPFAADGLAAFAAGTRRSKRSRSGFGLLAAAGWWSRGSQDVRVQVALQFHQPDDRRIRRDGRSGAPVLSACREATRSSPSCGPNCRAAKFGRSSSWRQPGVRPAGWRRRWRTISRRVPLVVSTAERIDETASLAHFVCPDHHYLESWGDAEPVSGLVSLTQPTIQPLQDTRSAARKPGGLETGKPRASRSICFAAHWSAAVHPRAARGPDRIRYFLGPNARTRQWPTIALRATRCTGDPVQLRRAVRAILRPRRIRDRGAFALVLYPKIGMLDGRHGHNAWLHELPDPVTKVTWDNYALFPRPQRNAWALRTVTSCVSTADGAPPLELPAFVQPGQHDASVAIALGYGRAGTDRFAKVGPPWFEARPPVGPGRRQRFNVGHNDGNSAPVLRSIGDGGQDRAYASAGVDAGPSLARAAGQATSGGPSCRKRRWRN